MALNKVICFLEKHVSPSPARDPAFVPRMVVDVGERDGVDQTHRERKKEKKKEREEERKKDVIVEYAALLRHKH